MHPSMEGSALRSSAAHTLLGNPPDTSLLAQRSAGGTTAASVMPPMMDPSQIYIAGFSSVAMPVNYATPAFSPATGAPVVMTSGAPLAYTASGASIRSSASLMLLGGGDLVSVGAAPMAVYQARSTPGMPQPLSSPALRGDTLRSFSLFSPASPGAPWLNTAGCFRPTGLILVKSVASPSPASLPPPPQYSSVVKSSASGATAFYQDVGGAGGVTRPVFGSYLTPVVRTGDAGKGYEAGAYYEGRVKRFNPIRGYGFLAATHKLIPLQCWKEMQLAKAAELITAPEKQGNSPNATLRINSGSGGEIEAKIGKGAPPMAVSGVNATAETNVHINGDDLVYIKGAPYVRHTVTMGDIFVHYHCLQLSPCEVDAEANGGFVNLPAGSPVQFKAEVFVPAELMEKASNNKEAAAMLKSLGVSVAENSNLLSGAIATKKGWGYQAMDVCLLPPKGTLPTQQGSLKSATAAEGIAAKGNFSDSMSPLSLRKHAASPPTGSAHEMPISDNDESSPTAPNRASSLPPLSQTLKICISAEQAGMPSPPSFEEAMSGMPQMMALPNCAACVPSYRVGRYR
ncbi:hypothetical protein GH5_01471 [Leishmania sp. Ghana 2012 LV757]|uniref:hypothetical protein n=1 Tax=Leishmania sp. Ghana 2012 LV757 TaxID=2803181 RepID=UPI001B591DEA|nr:hypothetical protein GH5_01471 [Leishmania sp. Ghana 2012 LV757]